MIKISRSHPIKLKYGQHYPREMLRTAFRKTRTACQQQSAERLLADVTDDEGMPLFTLVYEKNYLQKMSFRGYHVLMDFGRMIFFISRWMSWI